MSQIGGGSLNFRLAIGEMNFSIIWSKTISDQSPTVPRKSLGTFGLFSHKMAFLKSKFKDDLVRVQRHTVRHFKDLE